MQESSLVHILFRLQRDYHWEEPVKNEQALPFCQDLRTSTQAVQSTVTKAFGREERTQLRNRLKSQTEHVLQSKARSVSRTTCPLRTSESPKGSKAGKHSCAPVTEWLLTAMSPRSCGQACAAVRWLQVRAQVSRLVVLGRVQLE